MSRIFISAFFSAAIVAFGMASAPAAELKSDSQPTACDCSNCSAQYCQGPKGQTVTFTATIRSEQSKTGPAKTLQTE